jgi:hypothetical protein
MLHHNEMNTVSLQYRQITPPVSATGLLSVGKSVITGTYIEQYGATGTWLSIVVLGGKPFNHSKFLFLLANSHLIPILVSA